MNQNNYVNIFFTSGTTVAILVQDVKYHQKGTINIATNHRPTSLLFEMIIFVIT